MRNITEIIHRTWTNAFLRLPERFLRAARGHVLRAILTALAPKLRGDAGKRLALVLDLAGSDFADMHRQAYRIGGALLSVGAFRHNRRFR